MLSSSCGADTPVRNASSKRTKARRISTTLRALIFLGYALTTLPLRRQEVQTRMCFVAAPTLAWTGRRLTFQRRLLTLWAWLMVFPNCGPLPQISQTRAITLESFQACCRSLDFTGIRRISPRRRRGRRAYAALPITGSAQWLQRRASIGISLRHSGHFLVVGSAGTGSLRVRAIRALIGVTTKK